MNANVIFLFMLVLNTLFVNNEVNDKFYTSTINKPEPETIVLIKTNYGDFKVKLYNETINHKNNFIKLVKEGFYNGLLFHRVINEFVIQGGDPDSKNATTTQELGKNGPGYEIDAEFNNRYIHKKYALAAARPGDEKNPLRKSNGSQFYIVLGKIQTDNSLNSIANKTGAKWTIEQKQIYRDIGGTPHLDGYDTVFGEVIDGFEVIDKISSVMCDTNNRPLNDVKILSMSILENRIAVQKTEQERKERDIQIVKNSNKAIWKLGYKLCCTIDNGIICGTLNTWNEDKSMVQIKIITSPGGTLDGENLTKDNLIWVSTSGKGWHLCLNDEIQTSLSNDNSSFNNSISEIENFKIGDKYYLQSYERTGSFSSKFEDCNIAEAIVIDITEMKVEIEITKITERTRGWYQTLTGFGGNDDYGDAHYSSEITYLEKTYYRDSKYWFYKSEFTDMFSKTKPIECVKHGNLRFK